MTGHTPDETGGRVGEQEAVEAAARPLGISPPHMKVAAENFVRPIVARAYDAIAAAVRADVIERAAQAIDRRGRSWCQDYGRCHHVGCRVRHEAARLVREAS